MWPAAQNTVDAPVKWPQASEPNQTGFSLAFDTDESFYAALGEDPERARRFGGAMSWFTQGDEYSLRHLTDGYPLGALGSGSTVVDLGGSYGETAFAVAWKFPDLHLIVQELPEVVANSKEEEGVDVKFMAHDFFREQPVRGADVYMYRWTFHNWPDKYCVQILRALISALERGARVVVMDSVMPPPSVLPDDMDKNMRAVDLTMLEIENAREQDLEEWKSLFLQADSRFAFQGVKQPPGSYLAILECIWQV
ncbi:Uu.00g013770.m01.CDS01 [Anthostomella pinea]|uniref:Uu.00g013770.m01.CDS01 n=1 Tax=Anthostomella pinea TaxID=933095 RepID=A0AAI8VZF6_9PEZI|nr:Uu.00g013770.m01.CDS01 [Anthostomella pinea]